MGKISLIKREERTKDGTIASYQSTNPIERQNKQQKESLFYQPFALLESLQRNLQTVYRLEKPDPHLNWS